MKKLIMLFCAVLVTIIFSGCSTASVASPANPLITQPLTETETSTPPIAITYDLDDVAFSESTAQTTQIILNGETITFKGSGATVNGSFLTITAAGTYDLSGTLTDGQIIVDTQDPETVVLTLDGVNITSKTSAPIFIQNAEKTVITLAEGSENIITDGQSDVFDNEANNEPNAAIFSKDDLTINGQGSLTVNADYHDGIVSKDDLKITGGAITVNAENDGIKGRDSIAIKDGIISISAGSDGLQSNNDEDIEKGFIAIQGGNLDITAGSDGVQAQTRLDISGGTITITSGKGNQTKSIDSAKGLKAGVDIRIDGGEIQIDAQDDAIHSNENILINGGEIFLASEDDGIHADSSVTINDGKLTISRSYEGIEGALVTINGGDIHLQASDDGINISNGQRDQMGGPGQNISNENYLEINGGYIFVDAAGDGLDSNGMGRLNNGVVIVNGPIMDMNAALDVDGRLEINGGFLIAVGSAGMAQSPSTVSTQYSALVNFSGEQPAGSTIHIESANKEKIVTFTPSKSFESVVISAPELKNGETYIVYVGGSATGTVADGLYTNERYTPGIEVSSFTISSIVTGESIGMGGPRGGNRPTGGRP